MNTEAPVVSPTTRSIAQMFVTQTRKFVLCNGAPEKIEFDYAGCGHTISKDHGTLHFYGGQRVTIPASNQVVQKNKKFDVYHSFQKSDGSYVPGTLVIWDLHETPPGGGGTQKIWDAEAAIRDVLGIDPKSGEMTGMYASKGLRLLPNDPTDEVVDAVKAESKTAWEDFIYQTDLATVTADNERARVAQMRGQMPAPPAPYIQEAHARMRARAASRGETMETMIGRDQTKPSAPPEIDRLADVLAAVLTKTSEKIEAVSEAEPKRKRGRPRKEPEKV